MNSLADMEAIADGAAMADVPSTQETDGTGKGVTVEELVKNIKKLRTERSSDVSEPPGSPAHGTPPPCHPLRANPITPLSEDNASELQSLKGRNTLDDIHIPTRTSSTGKANPKRRGLRSSSNHNHTMRSHSTPTTARCFSRADSSADSLASFATSPSTAASIISQTLLRLQRTDRLSSLLEDDPNNFDLVAPVEETEPQVFPLESRAEELFSREHLEAIFQDPLSLSRFTSFLSHTRPKSVPILIYYLDAMKSICAINYANAVAEALESLDGYEFTTVPPRPTVNAALETKAQQAFDVLVREDLPAFVTHVVTQVVASSIHGRIMGNGSPLLRDRGAGLAEVFCLTDPSRPDNPIIFASEEFHRSTQYGVSSALGRNCRFLQGPKTNEDSIERLRKAVQAGKETTEIILNYRRDGSPFMNLLWLAPLFDSKGQLRYHIGAQVDVSGLVQDGTCLEAFQHMLKKKERKEQEHHKEELQELSYMFNDAEMETVRRYGGTMHRKLVEGQDHITTIRRPNVLLLNSSSGHVEVDVLAKPEMRPGAMYKHYLLVRPAPSLRILFSSSSLRVPGLLQSRLLDRIGGSRRIRDSLTEALTEGKRGVTAKIRWLSIPSSNPEDDDRLDDGKTRWIHCTPLLGSNGAVGVWMVVLVDDDDDKAPEPRRHFRQAPPVASEASLKSEAEAPENPSRLCERLRAEEKRSSLNVASVSSTDLLNGMKPQTPGSETGSSTTINGPNTSPFPSLVRLPKSSTQSLLLSNFENSRALSPSYFGARSALGPVQERPNSASPLSSTSPTSDIPQSPERGTDMGVIAKQKLEIKASVSRKLDIRGKQLSLPLLRTTSGYVRRARSASNAAAAGEQRSGSPTPEEGTSSPDVPP